MNIQKSLFIAFLFFVLTPGVFITLPNVNADKYQIAGVHAIAFVVVWYIIHSIVFKSNKYFTGEACSNYPRRDSDIAKADQWCTEKNRWVSHRC